MRLQPDRQLVVITATAFRPTLINDQGASGQKYVVHTRQRLHSLVCDASAAGQLDCMHTRKRLHTLISDAGATRQVDGLHTRKRRRPRL